MHCMLSLRLHCAVSLTIRQQSGLKTTSKRQHAFLFHSALLVVRLQIKNLGLLWWR